MGVVYMILCLTTGEIYYGSTKRDWKERLGDHRNNKGNHSTSANQIISRKNYEFIVLEEVDDDQLLIRERYYIDTFPCINQRRPFRTDEDKLEYDKQQKAELRKNKEYNDKQRQHAITQYECECGSTFQICKKARHLQSKKHLAYQSNRAI